MNDAQSTSAETQAGSLLAKTAGGAGWIVGFRLVTRLLGIVNTLILARLLGPGDFGLVAIASGFAQTVDAVTNLSVHEAIVREANPPQAMYDTAFTMSLIRGLITGVAIVVLAPWVAEFFHEPRLAWVLVALAASNLIGALENIATADFMRTLAFKREFQLWTIPRVVQVAATVTVALIFQTYWALVFGIVFGRLLRTGLSYVMRPYMPRLTLSAWRDITGFTTWSWAIGMVSILRERVDTVLIGRLFSPAQVGVYSLAGEIAYMPTSELVEPLCRACFPSFAQLRNSGTPVGPTYVRLLAVVALVVMPAGLGIAAVADPLVRLAFGAKWLEAIPLMQIFGVAGALGGLGSLSATLFSAHGMLRINFTIMVVMTVLRVVLLVSFVSGGTLVTVGVIVMLLGLVEQAAYVTLCVRRFGVRARDVVMAVHRGLLAALAMGGILIGLGLGFVAVPVAFGVHLVVSVVVGAVAYTLALAAIWGMEGCPDGAERDVLRVAHGILRKAATILSKLRVPARQI